MAARQSPALSCCAHGLDAARIHTCSRWPPEARQTPSTSTSTSSGSATGRTGETEEQTLRLLAAGGRLPDRLQATTAAIWARRLRTGHAALENARPQLEAALYGRVLRTLRAWLGEPQLTIELTMIEPAEQRTIVRTAAGIDVSLPFSWLPDVWMRGLAVTFGRLCIDAETTDGSSWTLHTLGPDLTDLTQLTIATR